MIFPPIKQASVVFKLNKSSHIFRVLQPGSTPRADSEITRGLSLQRRGAVEADVGEGRYDLCAPRSVVFGWVGDGCF